MALSFGLGWWARLPDLGTGGDDATYIALSHSLEHGRYREEYRVGAPRHGQYPPGTPAYLLAVRAIAGPGVDPIHAANLILLGIAALLMADAVRRLEGPWLGIGAGAATALNPTLLVWAGPVGSDIPYLALATVALWATLRADGLAGSRRWPAVAIAAGLAGFLTRIVGVSLLAGLAAWVWRRRRWQAMATLALLSILVVGAWFAWAHAAAGGAGSSYARDFRSITSTGGSSALATAQRMADNARGYATSLSLDGLGLPTTRTTIADNVVWLLFLAAPLALGLLRLWRSWPAAAGSLAAGAAILVVWVGQYPRFLLPILPILATALLLGFAQLGDRLPARLGAWVRILPALGLAGTGTWTFVTRDHWHLCDRAAPFDSPRCFDRAGRELVAAARFVRDSIPTGAVVATAEPSTVAYFSGHPATSLAMPEAGPLPAGAAVVILSTASNSEMGRAAPILHARCEALVLLKAVSPTTLVLAPARGAPKSPPSCPALATYLEQVRAEAGGTDSAPL